MVVGLCSERIAPRLIRGVGGLQSCYRYRIHPEFPGQCLKPRSVPVCLSRPLMRDTQPPAFAFTLAPSASALRFALAVLAVLLAGVAQYLIGGGLPWLAAVPLGIAVGCLVYVSRERRGADADDEGTSGDSYQMAVQGKLDLAEPRPTQRRNIKRWLTEPALGVGASLVSVLLMYVSLQGFGQAGSTTYTLAWWTYGVSVCLLLVATPALEGRWTELATKFRSNSRLAIDIEAAVPWLILGAILILGTAIRLYNLEDLPAGLWFDEADNLAHASRYADDPGRIPPYEPSTNLPTLFLLPIAALVKLTGVDITTPRLVAAAFGVLGIVATFLFVRHAMGARAALIAAFFIAVMRWDLNWSRIGMHGITGVLFAALSAWLTLRAIRSGRITDYVFAGASMGLGMWFYAPLRVFPLVIAFILLHHLIVHRHQVRWFICFAALMFCVALFVSAPIVQVATNDPEVSITRVFRTAYSRTLGHSERR